MAKLKLGAIADDKPVKLTVELPAAVHRDLLATNLIGDRFRAFSCPQKEASSVGELFRRNMFKELVHAPVRRTAASYGRPRGSGNSSWNIRPRFPLLA